MTTFDRAWNHSQNNVPADQTTEEKQSRNTWLEIVNDGFVTLGGWTIEQSCDSVSSPASDGGQWAVEGDLVWGTGAHSWCVLKSPNNFPSSGQNLYVCIDLDQGGDDDIIIRTGTADWTGGDVNGPGTGTNVVTYTHAWRADTLANRKWHMHASDEGDVILYVSEDSKGYAEFGLLFVACDDTQTGDSWPIYEFVDYDATTPGPFDDSSLGHTSYAQGRWIDGTADSQTVMVWPNRAGTSNAITDSFDVNGDDNTGKYPAFPVYACSVLATQISYRGRIYDIRAGPSAAGIVQGLTNEPSGASVESIMVGHLWIPAAETASF